MYYVLSTYSYVLSTYWYVPVQTSMYHHVLRMYQYVLDTGCTSMYLVFQIKQIREQNLAHPRNSP